MAHGHFLSFLNTNMALVVEIHPNGRQGPIYPKSSIPWLLITWQHKGWIICSHGIDLIFPEYSSPRTRRTDDNVKDKKNNYTYDWFSCPIKLIPCVNYSSTGISLCMAKIFLVIVKNRISYFTDYLCYFSWHVSWHKPSASVSCSSALDGWFWRPRGLSHRWNFKLKSNWYTFIHIFPFIFVICHHRTW